MPEAFRCKQMSDIFAGPFAQEGESQGDSHKTGPPFIGGPSVLDSVGYYFTSTIRTFCRFVLFASPKKAFVSVNDRQTA